MRGVSAVILAGGVALLPTIAEGRVLLRGGSHVVSPEAVRKPLTDRRQYEYVTFPHNGLKVLAVEDPHAVKAGFALAVEAGSFYDPKEFLGLAHFCEHLLFLGTKKYPDETSFDNFMAMYDGSNNAFTEQEHTVFYNEIGHAGFDEGMDRFAQFFIAPLFKQEMVGRELNAVNSEHEKNIPDQGRQLWEIMRGTANEDSVISRFYTGTVDTLHHGDNKTVAALKKYHEENYCGPRMNLVMVANMSTAEQLKVAHKHFDEVPRGQCGPKKDFGPGQPNVPAAFGGEHIGQYIRMGTKSTPALWVMFPLKPTEKDYKAGAMSYLGYVLSYAGAGSLRSQLKKKGLITDMGMQMDETSAASLLFVMFQLSPKGSEEAGVREITSEVFSFLRLLRDEKEHELPKVYESIAQMSRVDFDYKEAPDSVMDSVSDLARSMAKFPASDVLTASNGLVDQTDPALVRSLLAQIAGPRSASIALATQNFNASEANSYEKYYDIHFHRGQIPVEWEKDWSGSSGSLRSPPALMYVPSQLAVRNETAGEFPSMHMVDEKKGKGSVELWWKGQGNFPLPKAQLRVKLSVPKGQGEDASSDVMRQLHVALAKQVLEEATEDVQNCGLRFQMESIGPGYGVSVDGYDQHVGVLLAQALDGLLNPKFGSEEFARARRDVNDDLTDTTRKAPYEWAMDELSSLTTDDANNREDLLTALSAVNETQLRSYLSSLRDSGLRVQLLAVGNIEQPRAQDLARKAAEVVASTGGGRLLSVDQSRHSQVWKSTRPVEIRMRNPIVGDHNSATVNSYQFGVPDVSERVRMMMLGKMISNPVYDKLRTKRQLGYIVFGFVSEQAGVVELRVLVQGEKESPDNVDGYIEEVIDEFGTTLQNMSLAQFTKWKASLRSALHHKDQNMGQEADRYWSQIATDGHCFNRKELALKYLETLQKPADVVQTFEKLRHGYKKVSVKLFGANVDMDRKAPLAANSSIAVNSLAESTATLQVSGGDAISKRRLMGQASSASFFPTHAACAITSQ